MSYKGLFCKDIYMSSQLEKSDESKLNIQARYVHKK